MAVKVVSIRREPNPNTVRPNFSHHSFNYFKGKATAVLQAASVLVSTVTGTFFHELLKEKSMSAVDFNSVKPCISYIHVMALII
jgi:hypothetical protein